MMQMFNVCLIISPFLFGFLFTLAYSTTCILSTFSASKLLLRLSWFQFLSRKQATSAKFCEKPVKNATFARNFAKNDQKPGYKSGEVLVRDMRPRAKS